MWGEAQAFQDLCFLSVSSHTDIATCPLLSPRSDHLLCSENDRQPLQLIYSPLSSAPNGPLLLSPSSSFKGPQPTYFHSLLRFHLSPPKNVLHFLPLQVLLEKLTSDKLLLMLQGPLQMLLFGESLQTGGLLQDHPVQSHIHPGTFHHDSLPNLALIPLGFGTCPGWCWDPRRGVVVPEGDHFRRRVPSYRGLCYPPVEAHSWVRPQAIPEAFFCSPCIWVRARVKLAARRSLGLGPQGPDCYIFT